MKVNVTVNVITFPPRGILWVALGTVSYVGSGTLKREGLALTGVAHWVECQPTNQGVAGSISSQGTCLGCGPGP